MILAPLGDQAVLAYFPTEAEAVRFADTVRAVAPAWLQDVVPAYASVGVFFDGDRATLKDVMAWLEAVAQEPRPPGSGSSASPNPWRSRLLMIPVCYERQLDLARVAEHVGLSTERVIELHAASEYTVYAIGFVPGFPYLGYLPEALRGVGRLPSPRLRVEAGSVGLTGTQTGIYPLARPGGWNIIGRTPLTLVDVADGYFPLRVGDRVRFARIDEAEYQRLEGERLA